VSPGNGRTSYTVDQKPLDIEAALDELFCNLAGSKNHEGWVPMYAFKNLLLGSSCPVTPDDGFMSRIDMDEDGQVSYDEFKSAMFELCSEDEILTIKLGSFGTTWRRSADIQWLQLHMLIVLALATLLGSLIYFKWILCPLFAAYFLNFAMGPLLDLMTVRPLKCGKRAEFCANSQVGTPNSEAPARPGGLRGCLGDLLLHGKIPHTLGCLVTILLTMLMIAAIVALTTSEVHRIIDDPIFMKALKDGANRAHKHLLDIGFNVTELHAVVMQNKAPSNITLITEVSIVAIGQGAGLAATVVSDVFLVTLLAIYILVDRQNGSLFQQNNEQEPSIMSEIEHQMENYLKLKTLVSIITGLLVYIFLFACNVRMAFTLSLLSFLLNFIPNVGSMIASFLPLPLIMCDPNLSGMQQILGFFLPGFVQFVIGNLVEPMVFGKSLNLTSLSILATLVIWTTLWGVIGSVLSVPLLCIMKVCCKHCDHPVAKSLFMMVSENPGLDIYSHLERQKDSHMSTHRTSHAHEILQQQETAM